MSLPQQVRFRIVAFLTLAAVLPSMDLAEQEVTRSRLREQQHVMARLAAHCPDNFLHLSLIMQAELARISGQSARALTLYEEAIETARHYEFRRDEAMANELAARCLLASGRQKACEGYLRAARNLYDRWGARRKVASLEYEFPQVLKSVAARAVLTSTTPVDSAELDMASIMKASQAISSEMVLDQLWIITMRIMLEKRRRSARMHRRLEGRTACHRGTDGNRRRRPLDRALDPACRTGRGAHRACLPRLCSVKRRSRDRAQRRGHDARICTGRLFSFT